MSDQRKGGIAWTDVTLNPLRARLNGKVGHHCVKASAGCAHCYSSRRQVRFGLPPFEVGKRAGVEPFFEPKVLRQVLGRRKPTKFFWCDMTDLFGDWVLDEWIDQCFAVMALTPQHTHQLLTKRPERMLAYVSAAADRVPRRMDTLRAELPGRKLPPRPCFDWPLPFVWLGVSAEDQATADERIPLLMQTPAAVRWVSLEPLLAPVDLDYWLTGCGGVPDPLLRWIVIGGESGPKARPCDLAWIRDVVRQCREAGVRCFVKQLGSFVSDVWTAHGRPWLNECAGRETFRHSKAGDPAEWPLDLRVREFPG